MTSDAGEDSPFNLGAALPDLIPHPHRQLDRDNRTYFASNIGFCQRQLYLVKAGVKTGDRRGRGEAKQVIQEHVQSALRFRYPGLTIGPSTVVEEEDIRIVGRCTCYDPGSETVYQLKPRDGWYRFHPPVDRHLDQMHAYIAGLGAERGQLCYISMSDLTDVRIWPPLQEEAEYLQFDEGRLEGLISKASTVTEALQHTPNPATEADVPFPECGCYFCENESTTLEDEADTGTGSGGEGGESTGGNTDSTTEQDQVESIQARPLPPPDSEPAVIEPGARHIPAQLQERDIWVVWDGRQKIPKAPWNTGTMYPAKWGADHEEDPRRPFEKAEMVAELPPERIHDSWPFPDGDDLPESVRPAVLLRHDPSEPRVVVIDLDGVRDPATGEVTGEALEILSVVGGYAELSPSGEGLHVFLQGRLPTSLARFSAPLRETGRIEIYDQSRFLASTWHHVSRTTKNGVPIDQGGIDRLLATYISKSTQQGVVVETAE